MSDDFNTPPDPHMIGRSMRHTGNGKTYVILGYVWNGETDKWNYLHRAAGEDGPIITRPLSHLAGVRRNGENRYEFFSWEAPK